MISEVLKRVTIGLSSRKLLYLKTVQTNLGFKLLQSLFVELIWLLAGKPALPEHLHPRLAR